MKLSFLKLFYLLLSVSFFLSINIFAISSADDKNRFPTNQTKEDQQRDGSIDFPRSEEADKDFAAKKQAQGNSAPSMNFFEGATYEGFEPQDDFEVFDKSYLGSESAAAKSTDGANIDSGAITLIQSAFLGKLNTAFSTVAKYALNLLYLFTVLELVIFGFIWALQRDVGWDKFFFKIIKIGLIFFIIQNYSWLLNTIMHSFAKLAGVVINGGSAAQYIFNPAKIWQYGYDSGVHLLQLATTSNNFGMVMVLISLGIGILLVFGLLGIQMVLQIVGFYLVSFGSLILLPFGAFTLSRGMFDKAVQAVLQAGIRLMVLIIIIGIAVVVWDGFQLTDMETTAEFNINQPLGLFFTALLFLCLAFYLPKVLSQTVGGFGSDLSYGAAASPVVINESASAPIMLTGESGNMHAATAIEAPNMPMTSGYMARSGDVGGVTVAAAQPVPGAVTSTSGSIEGKRTKETLGQASYLAKSISESTVKKIKEEILQAAQEKK